MKKLSLVFLILGSFTLTGCLEELLASLCKKLASNDSIIAVFNTDDTSYKDYPAVVTYTDVNGDTYQLSDCDSAFSFPTGQRKSHGTSISFMTVLDTEGQNFFKDQNGELNTADEFRVKIDFYTDSSCSTIHASSPESDPAPLVWESVMDGSEIPPELAMVEECSVTGKAAMIEVTDIQ